MDVKKKNARTRVGLFFVPITGVGSCFSSRRDGMGGGGGVEGGYIPLAAVDFITIFSRARSFSIIHISNTVLHRFTRLQGGIL